MALYVKGDLMTMKVKCTKDRWGACLAITGNTMVPSMGTGSLKNPDSGPYIPFGYTSGIFILKRAQ